MGFRLESRSETLATCLPASDCAPAQPSKQTGRLPRSRNRQNFPANNPWVDVPKNLRLVQEHLRHADIQTTTVYTRVTQHELQQAVSVFDKTRS